LAGSGIFAELSAEERSAVEKHSTYITFEEAERVFQEGDAADNFYVIESGEILIRQQEDETRSRDVARFIAGESFGELDVLRGSVRSATAVASGTTRILVFPEPPQRFEDIMAGDPVVFARVLQKLIAFLASRIRSTNQLLSENSSWVRELRRQVYSDKLTGLYNTAFLKDSFKDFPPSDQEASTLLMLKPDRFKEINDTYGHEVGDRTIQILARRFQDVVEPLGSPVRYRGNEMAALLPGRTTSEATRLANTLQEDIGAIDITSMTGGEAVTITTSVGIAEAPSDGRRGETLLEVAYERLMRARNDGGDRIYTAAEDADHG
jgi:diguanylate cyclase (GGDEF)-like protein